MKLVLRTVATAAFTLALATGCSKKADNTINLHQRDQQLLFRASACLFAEPKQFPAQVTTSDTSKTAPLDALVDQGLLVRTTAEKKVLIIASKQVTNYDLRAMAAPHGLPTPPNPGSATSATVIARSVPSTPLRRPPRIPAQPPRWPITTPSTACHHGRRRRRQRTLTPASVPISLARRLLPQP